jgi:hypothetical protein
MPAVVNRVCSGTATAYQIVINIEIRLSGFRICFVPHPIKACQDLVFRSDLSGVGFRSAHKQSEAGGNAKETSDLLRDVDGNIVDMPAPCQNQPTIICFGDVEIGFVHFKVHRERRGAVGRRTARPVWRGTCSSVWDATLLSVQFVRIARRVLETTGEGTRSLFRLHKFLPATFCFGKARQYGHPYARVMPNAQTTAFRLVPMPCANSTLSLAGPFLKLDLKLAKARFILGFAGIGSWPVV